MKRLLITGGSSMLAKHIIPLLSDYNILAPTHKELDLLDSVLVDDCFNKFRPHYCLHLATAGKSMRHNMEFPATTFLETTQIGFNVLEACRYYNVNKVLSILSSCCYPYSIENCIELDMQAGPCHPSIESHGLAKRNVESYSRFLNQQFGLNSATVCLQNMSGEYDKTDETTKVVMALIKKFVEAKERKTEFVEIHGTGIAEREFLYAGDAAKIIVFILEHYDDYKETINVGPGKLTSIKQLAELIKVLTAYQGKIKWLNDGDGQLRKFLDTEKLKLCLDFDFTPLENWLSKTINWYKENKN